ncbi:MAG TPA: GGDEF domain-containing protein [Parvularculaceae bacterium]|nr:GGDEF domain-containing protein [Parvularculaceae bacterium]
MTISNAPSALSQRTTLFPTPAEERAIPEKELTPRVLDLLDLLRGEIASLNAELAASRARIGELEELAETDPLSGVLNRRGFLRELERATAVADRFSTPSSLVFADLNNLKVINDKFGHAAGDAALIHVAGILSQNIRKTDAVGRLGGDEFGVLLARTDDKTARAKATSLSASVAAAPVLWEGSSFSVSVSVGAAEISKGITPDQALAAADRVMYGAKQDK